MKDSAWFIGGWDKARAAQLDAQRTVNMIVERDPRSARALSMFSRPGLTQRIAIAGDTVRGIHAFSESRLFAVVDDGFYEINGPAPYTSTSRGTLTTTAGRVSLSSNGTQVMISDGGGRGYTFNTSTNTFAAIADTDAPTSDQNVFLDGYTVANKQGTGSFQISAAYDSTDWNAADIKTAESDPDHLLAVAVTRRNLWCFGQSTTEVFYNSGASFPLDRIQGATMETGTLAAWSVAKLGETFYWLARNKQSEGFVLRNNGFQLERISTPAVEWHITQYTAKDTAEAFAFSLNGHGFYVLTFPGVPVTWVYDDAANEWYQWESYGLSRWIPSAYAFWDGMHMVGDYRSGVIYEVDDGVYKDGTLPIVQLRAGRHGFGPDNERLPYDSFEVTFQAGVGNADAPTPQAMMRYSNDGGMTWSAERQTTIGAVGNYKTRARWMRCGQAREKVFEVSVSDPVKVVITGAVVNGRD